MPPYEGNSNEFELRDLPTELIQSVKFGQTDNQHLLVASWDCSVRLYDITANKLKAKYIHDEPVLDASFHGNNTSYSGGGDAKLRKYDFQSQTEYVVGQHADTIRSVEYIPDVNLIATGGWDKSFKLWDPRIVDQSNVPPVRDNQLPEKVYSMSACGEKLIIATSGRQIFIWDLRKMTHAQKSSQLKYQTRCVAASADRRGYVVASIEGRCAVEYLDEDPKVQEQRYVFKCHRNKDPATGLEIIYPVNAVSFHNRYNTFATGGSDGFVSIWDGKNKKRLVQFRRYPTSIPSLSFSPDGTTLAIASSYLHSSEETDTLRDIPPDSIFIRRVPDSEARQTKLD